MRLEVALGVIAALLSASNGVARSVQECLCYQNCWSDDERAQSAEEQMAVFAALSGEPTP